RLLERVMITLTAFGARIATDDALDQPVRIDLEFDDCVELLVLARQHLVECRGLGQRARESVQGEALLAVRLVDPVGDDLDDNLVGDEVTPLHARLGPLAHVGSRLDGGAQHVTSRELNQPVAVLDLFGLRSLSGPWRSEQNEVHGYAPSAST